MNFKATLWFFWIDLSDFKNLIILDAMSQVIRSIYNIMIYSYIIIFFGVADKSSSNELRKETLN